MTRFKTGDIVKIKGNSVLMTVESVSHNQVKVVWFDSENRLISTVLDEKLLEKYLSKTERIKLLQEEK